MQVANDPLSEKKKRRAVYLLNASRKTRKESCTGRLLASCAGHVCVLLFVLYQLDLRLQFLEAQKGREEEKVSLTRVPQPNEELRKCSLNSRG